MKTQIFTLSCLFLSVFIFGQTQNGIFLGYATSTNQTWIFGFEKPTKIGRYQFEAGVNFCKDSPLPENFISGKREQHYKFSLFIFGDKYYKQDYVLSKFLKSPKQFYNAAITYDCFFLNKQNRFNAYIGCGGGVNYVPKVEIVTLEEKVLSSSERFEYTSIITGTTFRDYSLDSHVYSETVKSQIFINFISKIGINYRLKKWNISAEIGLNSFLTGSKTTKLRPEAFGYNITKQNLYRKIMLTYHI